MKRVSMILLCGLVFLTPFLFVQNTNELFEFPKMYFVYFTGSLLTLLVIVSAILTHNRKTFTPTSPESFPLLLGLFIANFIVSTIFSTHLYTSVWGYFSRFNGGLVSVLIFAGIYLAVVFLKPPVKEILRIVSLTLLPISVYAILQHSGLGGRWLSDTTVRVFSTFGQPNWYGAYCAVVLPIILYFGLEEKSQTARKIGWFSLLTLGLCGFWFAYSVSGIIGLAISTVLVVLLNFKLVKNSFAELTAVMLIFLVFTFLNPGIFQQKINDALKDFFPSTSLTPTTPPSIENDHTEPSESQTDGDNVYNLTDSGFIRKGIWEGTIKLALSSPKVFLIGTGPETFPYEFQRFRPASLNYSSEWNFILNKPHNYYLELLAQNGIVGLLIYLAIILKVLLAKHPVLTPALFGLFVTNIFGWPTVSTTLLFWVFLALLTVDRVGGGRESPRNNLPVNLLGIPAPRLAASTIPIVVYAILNIQFAKQYLADVASKASSRYFDQGSTQKALDLSNQSINLNPHEPFYFRQRAKAHILETVGKNVNEASSAKAAALKDLQEAYQLNPKNLATLRGEAPLYYFLTLEDIAAAAQQKPQANEFDPFYLELAKNYYQKLSQTYPEDAGVLALVAKYQKMSGLDTDYKKTVNQIKLLRPDLLDWYLR